MRAMRLAGLVLLVVTLTATGYPPLPKAKENKDGAKELSKAVQGTWEATKIERGGPGKVGNPAGYVYRVTIDGEKLTQTTTIQGRELAGIPLTFSLDARKSPAEFVLTYTLGGDSKEVKIKGILKVEGDQMLWAYTTGDGQRPTKVDGKLTAGQSRFTMKRVKK